MRLLALIIALFSLTACNQDWGPAPKEYIVERPEPVEVLPAEPVVVERPEPIIVERAEPVIVERVGPVEVLPAERRRVRNLERGRGF